MSPHTTRPEMKSPRAWEHTANASALFLHETNYRFSHVPLSAGSSKPAIVLKSHPMNISPHFCERKLHNFIRHTLRFFYQPTVRHCNFRNLTFKYNSQQFVVSVSDANMIGIRRKFNLCTSSGESVTFHFCLKGSGSG